MAFPIPNPPIDQIDIDTVRLVEPVNLSLAPDPRHNVHFYAVWRQIGGVVPLAGTWSKLNDFHQCSFEVLSRMIFNVFEIQQQQVMGPNNQIIAINWDGNLQNLYFVFVNVETNFTTNEKRLVVNRALGFRCAESPNLPIPNCSIAICTYDAVGNRFRPVVMQHCEVGYRVRTYTATVDSKKRPGGPKKRCLNRDQGCVMSGLEAIFSEPFTRPDNIYRRPNMALNQRIVAYTRGDLQGAHVFPLAHHQNWDYLLSRHPNLIRDNGWIFTRSHMRYNKEEPESLEYRGINSMRNMVIMRRAIHRAFDAHEITVDPETNQILDLSWSEKPEIALTHRFVPQFVPQLPPLNALGLPNHKSAMNPPKALWNYHFRQASAASIRNNAITRDFEIPGNSGYPLLYNGHWREGQFLN